MNLAKFYIYGGINENFLPQMSNFPTTFHAHIELWVKKKSNIPVGGNMGGGITELKSSLCCCYVKIRSAMRIGFNRWLRAFGGMQ